jgi:hypothetical protein
MGSEEMWSSAVKLLGKIKVYTNRHEGGKLFLVFLEIQKMEFPGNSP